jgi:uncharacterized protein
MDTALPGLIQQMLQPEFYPHPVQVPIQLIQTHISYVLLTGDYAYKVKKDISFGFLDFTTLEKRRYFCQEELRLNRRLSPELYLAVLPIIQNSGDYRFGIDSANVDAVVATSQKIAEYAVKMQQFPQEMLFSHLFQDGKLTPELIRQLSDRVATFHAKAEANDDIRAYGSVTAIGTVERNNYRLSEAFIGRSQTQQQYDQTRTFTTQFLTQHTDWFVQRQAEGKIRDCHGDLHLNNVCLYQDKIQIFDCIEFNQEFRNIDVIYDAAFMVMDLEFQGRRDLANIFLNRYLEQTGDYKGAVLLPLYLSMRAYIRANVNSFALNDPAISSTDKAGFLQRAQDYYRLAWNYTQRTLGGKRSQGRLILMSGLSGSGKSTVARQLAQTLNAIHIRSDAVRKHLADIPLRQRGDTGGNDESGNYESGIYTPEMTQKTYDTLLELGLLLAQQGWSVILDAKYDRQDLRQPVFEGAIANQIPVQIVVCTAPVEVLRDRLRTRTGDIADATAAILDHQIKSAEPLTEAEQTVAVILRTDQSIDSQLAQMGLNLNLA